MRETEVSGSAVIHFMGDGDGGTEGFAKRLESRRSSNRERIARMNLRDDEYSVFGNPESKLAVWDLTVGC